MTIARTAGATEAPERRRRSKKVLNHEPEPFVSSGIPGERLSIQVGCLTVREATKKRLEPKKTAAARGKRSKRRTVSYLYIEYWFQWKEQDREGIWHCRSCYLGGHPKGRSPRGKLVARIDIVETQKAQDRPYGETLMLMGLGSKMGRSG